MRANIMPPGPESARAQHGLQEVWRLSHKNLVRAADWLFIGYSFPTYDSEVRSLLASALRARSTPPNVWIVDYWEEPDGFAKSAVVSRARDLLGKELIRPEMVNLGGLGRFPEFGKANTSAL
jgi:hypothetical protein